MSLRANHQRLLSMCSAAVLSAASYMATEGAAIAEARTTGWPIKSQSVNATQTTAPPKAAANPAANSQTHPTTQKTMAKTTKRVVKQKYKDGTWVAGAYNRYGMVQVSVTLKKDKITSCQITQCTTHYPQSYIDPILPQELVQRQDVNQIDVISGATASTEDFYYAVVYALQSAKKAQAGQSRPSLQTTHNG